MHYAIRVQGHLDLSWQARFASLRIEHQDAGTTLLSGYLPDQAAREAGALTAHPSGSDLALS